MSRKKKRGKKGFGQSFVVEAFSASPIERNRGRKKKSQKDSPTLGLKSPALKIGGTRRGGTLRRERCPGGRYTRQIESLGRTQVLAGPGKPQRGALNKRAKPTIICKKICHTFEGPIEGEKSTENEKKATARPRTNNYPKKQERGQRLAQRCRQTQSPGASIKKHKNKRRRIEMPGEKHANLAIRLSFRSGLGAEPRTELRRRRV